MTLLLFVTVDDDDDDDDDDDVTNVFVLAMKWSSKQKTGDFLQTPAL